MSIVNKVPMHITLEEAAERIIICGAHELDDHYSKERTHAIISIGEQYRAFGIDFDFRKSNHAELGKTSPDHAIKELIEQELKIAEQMLLDAKANDKDVIFHCLAGRSRSPTFVLLFLNHIQGNNPDYDRSLYYLHQIHPVARIGPEMRKYKAYLADKHENLKSAIQDYIGARALAECRNQDEVDSCLAHHFNDNAPDAPEAITAFCGRFGITAHNLEL